jgi:hypothetical protein
MVEFNLISGKGPLGFFSPVSAPKPPTQAGSL